MEEMKSAVSRETPAYLREHEALYRSDPHGAALEWFRNARFGLFMHYGVYSLLGRGEWVMFHERIPVSEYEELKARFTAEQFDADFIADLALSAGARYVNITTRHHDSFCLFRTAATGFNSLNSPAGRDLIAELAVACRQRGLGLFLYYSYAADWRHPYFYSREAGWHAARPAYDTPDPSYKFCCDKDFRYYIDFVHTQLRELLTQYGPVAGIWFDPIMGYYHRPDLFPVEETYALIRSLQPQCLIAFKTGATGTEDFASPEHTAEGLAERMRRSKAPEHAIQAAERAWTGNRDNPRNEICTTLTNRHWGYSNQPDIEHRSADDVLRMLNEADAHNCNLLLNTGPLPDGSINPTDEATLREVGRRLCDRQGSREKRA
ncbi:MAG: alpha-L-fucosidase [Kiritimatiellaeota bacterium]|nr:alpha-L-fucosidase [Kiritimatiellota bacterium]